MAEVSRAHRILWPLVGGRWGLRIALLLAVLAVVMLKAPAALAFPYHARIGAYDIYADRPIPPTIHAVLARADRLVAASPLAEPGLRRQLVLTDGGWRWRVLALTLPRTIAFRRPFSDVLVFNRSDVGGDRVTNGAPLAGTRTLSGTIAHETMHLLMARRYGEWHHARLPEWKREGYADYVARESSLDPRDEARLRAVAPDTGPLRYFAARRRVAAALAANGGSVDTLIR